MIISNLIDTATAMSISDRQKSLRWLSRQNELVIYDVFRVQKNHFHRLKSQGLVDDLILLSIASLFGHQRYCRVISVAKS